MLGHGRVIVEVGLNVRGIEVGEGFEELLNEIPFRPLASTILVFYTSGV